VTARAEPIDPSDDRPWIATIPWDEATGVLRQAYDWQAERLGAPTEFTQLGSLAPELVLTRLRLYRAVEQVASGLTVVERRIAAYVTSCLNGTPHCASGLRVQLRDLGVDDEIVERAADRPADLGSGDARLDAIAAHAAVLAARPFDVRADDLLRLRALGLTDIDLLDLNNVVAYYAYINRVANGLGLRTVVPDDHARHAVPS
jgi:uncharacterized peroxidase-related enzyme